MYTAFFGLREKPFALSPDPRFLFLSLSHREALAHLLYGIEQGEGFIAVTGEVGTGKTTLCRTLLRRLDSDVEFAFIFNPKLSAVELMEAILEEFGIAADDHSPRGLVAQLNRFLLERRKSGHRVLLILDEAQGLAAETLEQIRLLSNLETENAKLIQILMLGQPELDAMLEAPALRQLRQRIGVRWRLSSLSRQETAAYIQHRLRVAAGGERNPFTPAALRAIHRYSRGIPRRVNLLADRALLAAYAASASRVGRGFVRQAAAELSGRPTSRRRRGLWTGLAAASLAGLIALGLAWELAPRAWLPGATSTDLALPVYGVGATAPSPSLADRAEPGYPSPPLRVTQSVDEFERALVATPPDVAAANTYRALLEAWGQRVSPAPDAVTVEAGIELLEMVGFNVTFLPDTDLIELELLGHPALLNLIGSDGVFRVVALRRVGEEFVELRGLLESPALVSPSTLDQAWTGEAFVVWRDHESLPPLLQGGDRGTGVSWVQDALGELGFFAGAASGSFDFATERAVRAFQVAYHLPPDSQVGPLTKMSLYRALPRYAIPRLDEAPASRHGVERP